VTVLEGNDMPPEGVPVVGEVWAYRARQQDPLVQVAVARLGVKKPQRVLVRFVDDEFEGLQDWFPPARLKVPWSGVEEYVARERRWDEVWRPSLDASDAEGLAASIVYDRPIPEDLADPGVEMPQEGPATAHLMDWRQSRSPRRPGMPYRRTSPIAGPGTLLDNSPVRLCA